MFRAPLLEIGYPESETKLFFVDFYITHMSIEHNSDNYDWKLSF